MLYKIFVEGDDFDKSTGDGSLPETPIISTKIKSIPREDANAEVEKGELVLDTETGTLHKALGKPHSKGGTPVNLKEGSFIFSNFKDLSIDKKQKTLFEFKSGGSKPKNNTPSKVLEREVDLEHHNKMIDILQNEKKYDNITTNSAKLMVLRNLEKAGQVAFIQETKKGDEVPSFAKNTAPVYSKDTDQQITQSMQYLQEGGLKSYQDGSKYTLTPEEKKKALLKKLQDITGYTPYGKEGNKSLYKKFKENNGPKMTNEQWAAWVKTPEAIASRAKRATQQTDYGYTEPKMTVIAPEQIPWKNASIPSQITTRPTTLGEAPAEPEGIIDRTNQKSHLTPWQYVNMAYPWFKGMQVKTQYPIRQSQENVIPRYENKNVQPLLDENNRNYFNAASLTRTMNPNQGSAYLQQMYGNRTDTNLKSISDVQDYNIQTQNRQKEMAANSLNADAAANRAFDLKYYDQTQTALKNSDELKQAYETQGIQGINDTMSKKLAFDSWLNIQQQYKGKPTYKDKDGVQHYEGTPLFSPKAGFFGNTVVNNPIGIDWKTYQSSMNNKEDNFDSQLKMYRETFPGASDSDLIKLVIAKGKDKTVSAYGKSLSQPYKMGGGFSINFRPKNTSY